MARGSKAKKRQDALFDNANEELTVTKKPQRKAAGFELLSMQQEDDIEDDSAGEENELKPESKKKKKNSRKKGSTVDTTEVADAETVEKSLDELNLEGLAKKKKKSKKSKSSSKESSAENLPSAAGGSGAVSEASEDENAEPGSFVRKSENLTATGILLSHERSKDIQIDKFSVAAFGHQLVSDTSLTLLYGKKYGLCGRNGCGKSTLLRCLAHREVPIQSTVDLYLLEREYDPTELTAVEAVVDIVKTEKLKLEQEMDELLSSVETAHSERIDFVQERLNELDLSFAEQKARQVLKGLEFTEEMQDTKTKEFSGGWRMRVALARALFVKPTVLLLDDATNHLDLGAVVWLEEYLKSYPHTLVIVSHSQDLLNAVCTDIMYLEDRKLQYFTGDYDNFVKVKAELDENARKKAKADEKKLKKIKENLGRTGVQAKQAKSHEKAFQKRLEKDGAAAEDSNAPTGSSSISNKKLEINFQACEGNLPSPFLKFNDVAFGYPGRQQLFHSLNFGIDSNSRVALVGKNGAGKSTIMKLMAQELEPTSGTVYAHHHLRVARFNQHLTELLDLSQSAVEWLCGQFGGSIKPQQMRSVVGRFGLTGKSQVVPMCQLSDGQLRRVVFAWLAQKNCHLLMLDEPTNFLDPETIDALAEGIRNFEGGVVLVSHDFRLINQVAEEIWTVEDGEVDVWDGDIQEYKTYVKKRMAAGKY